METIAQEKLESQEELEKLVQKDKEDYGDESIRRSSGKRSVEESEKESGLLWKRPLFMNSDNSLEPWSMREVQREKMSVMAIALVSLVLSIG